jgi:DHA2 family multidrug resistance protein-like MFS transporter
MPPGYVVGAALAISVVGYALLSQVDSATGPAITVTGLVIVFVGGGMWGALGTDLVVGAAPPETAGSASSLSETGTELGVALGVAALGSLGTAVYRHQIAASLPAEVPAEATDAARDTLAGATAASAQLPDHLGTALLDPARDAFTDALNTVAGVSAVAVAVLAILAVTLLRRTPASTVATPAEEYADEANVERAACDL